eukprot:CAMPEP_0177562204 /NCGR_PEP_ID=MMETSP0369-20130122/72365_1 /TAXON_ID=447022 ORGANISM="Scrippsiella hangoei-like, Strain SHHI-4" /NCGR_SAMPLE_ID=MMETSP0369 /ASSEMBLY_ACC=CAM_ASM_000364 /LENGTH=47 /DNA_ID= /DNA_START= /DNA_END= /DNA_ORIENTATION=
MTICACAAELGAGDKTSLRLFSFFRLDPVPKHHNRSRRLNPARNVDR